MASRLMLSVRAGSFGGSSGVSRISATPFPLQRRLFESAAPPEGEKKKNEEAKAAQLRSYFSLPRMNASANNDSSSNVNNEGSSNVNANNEGSSNVKADNSSSNNNSVFPSISGQPVEIFGRKITFTYGHVVSGVAGVFLLFLGGIFGFWFRLLFVLLLAVGLLF